RRSRRCDGQRSSKRSGPDSSRRHHRRPGGARRGGLDRWRRDQMSRQSRLLPLALACLAASPGTPAPEPHAFRREGQVMGTLVTFTAWTTDEDAAQRAFEKAFDELKRLDRLLTDWKREGQSPSDVVRINEAAGKRAVKVAPETLEIIAASIDMSRR